jgi:intracellular multiplication protein IcmD
MKVIALVLVASLVLPACSGSNNTVPLSGPAPALLTLSAPIQTIDALDDTTPVGTSNAGAVLPLFAVPAIATDYGTLSVLVWGTKDPAGNIQAIEEIAVDASGGFQSGPSVDVANLFFDTSGHLISIVDQSTGYSVLFGTMSPAQLTAALCDPNLNAVGTIAASADSNGNPQGQVVAGGTCAPANPFALAVAAPGSPGGAPGAIATNLGNLSSIAKLITAGSYVAGMGFVVAALLKFKQHKDHPTQVSISLPIALLFVAAALIFIPTIFSAAGNTLFGSEPSLLGGSSLPAFTVPP